MKKTFLVLGIAAILMICLESLTIHPVVKKDGAAPGFTGSPGDGYKNCTACHGGTALEVEDWIYSNIPAEGYTPGQTYTITVVNKEAGATRFGFEISPQNFAGDYMGQMIVTDEIRTKLISDTAVQNGPLKYLTYTADGVESLDSAVWQFNWVAPTSGSGTVTFYAGFNSNYEGHKEGDKTYLDTMAVSEKGTNSISRFDKKSVSFKQYPNPSNGTFNVSFTLTKKETVLIRLYDLSGKLISKILENELESGKHLLPVQLSSEIPSGQYLVRFTAGGKSFSEPILIK